MRILMFHVDLFKSTITEKGRSKLIEPFDDPVTEIGEGLIVFAAVEKSDESDAETIAIKAVQTIESHAEAIKAGTIVIHPFAHLFVELGAVKTAVEILDMTAERLRESGYLVYRTPFGWFNELEIKAKGHPLSRVARQITAD
ncbi:MAG: threonyl-tRNA synthetase editing domain-containing protein [Candidatus Aquicultorales bacterium]